MDKSEALTIAKRYAQAIKLNFDCKKVILFGSYAKGNFNEQSDIDIAVVFNEYSNGLDIQLKLMQIRRKIDSRIEPHPFTEKDFTVSNPLVNEILKYGQNIELNI